MPMYTAPLSSAVKRRNEQRRAYARQALCALKKRRAAHHAALQTTLSLEPLSKSWHAACARLVAFAAIAPERLAMHAIMLALVILVIGGKDLFALSQQALRDTGMGSLVAARAVSVAQPTPSGDAIPYTLVAAPGVPSDARVSFRSAPGQSAQRLVVPPTLAPLPVYSAFRATHELQAGESLGSVAAQYQVGLEALIWANGLEQGDVPWIGQKLRIPRVAGMPYIVDQGDTLAAVSARFGVEPATILGFAPNMLTESLHPEIRLAVGQELFIPRENIPLPPSLLRLRGSLRELAELTARPVGVAQESQINIRSGPSREYGRVLQLAVGNQVQLIGRSADWLKVERRGITGWVRADLVQTVPQQVAALPTLNDFPPPPPRWVWPARGTITSGFGRRWGGFHNGLDIANRARTPIVAASSGRVKEAGWCRGYGYCVKISHGGGIETHYGHLIERPLVRVGEEVVAGQAIGSMGSTYDRAGGGYSTGVHLHLTVLVNGVAVNPLQFLP